MSLPVYGNFKSKPEDIYLLEKGAIDLIDGYITSPESASSTISEIFKRINYTPAPKGLRDYIGYDISDISEFIYSRYHLWRLKDDVVLLLPAALRSAIVDLVDTIGKKGNRASLGNIFVYLRTNHLEALPFLPTPTNGSSVDAVRSFILDFPNLFRLINHEDGNEWTRTTPLGNIVVECLSSVMGGVILLNIRPATVVTSKSLSPSSVTSSQPSSAQPAAGVTANGIAEMIRLTSAWGYLQTDEYGPIFFTSSACGNENLLSKGFKLGGQVAYEARYSEDFVQMFNNAPVKWRATKVRHLTSAERDAYANGLTVVQADGAHSTTSSSTMSSRCSPVAPRPTITSPVVPVPLPISSPTVPLPDATSGQASSLEPRSRIEASLVRKENVLESNKSDGGASLVPKSTTAPVQRSPTTLAEWMRRRQAQSKTQQSQPAATVTGLQPQTLVPPSKATDLSASGQLQNVHEREASERQNVASGNVFTTNGPLPATLQDIESELECENGIHLGEQPSSTIPSSHGSAPIQQHDFNSTLDQSQDTGNSLDHQNTTIGSSKASGTDASVDCVPEQCDVSIQTDVTDEELLLRLLRSSPEFLDLIRITLRE